MTQESSLKFQLSILNRSRENHDSPNSLIMDRRTDGHLELYNSFATNKDSNIHKQCSMTNGQMDQMQRKVALEHLSQKPSLKNSNRLSFISAEKITFLLQHYGLTDGRIDKVTYRVATKSRNYLGYIQQLEGLSKNNLRRLIKLLCKFYPCIKKILKKVKHKLVRPWLWSTIVGTH